MKNILKSIFRTVACLDGATFYTKRYPELDGNEEHRQINEMLEDEIPDVPEYYYAARPQVNGSYSIFKCTVTNSLFKGPTPMQPDRETSHERIMRNLSQDSAHKEMQKFEEAAQQKYQALPLYIRNRIKPCVADRWHYRHMS